MRVLIGIPQLSMLQWECVTMKLPATLSCKDNHCDPLRGTIIEEA